jgi:hypothetical protein
MGIVSSQEEKCCTARYFEKDVCITLYYVIIPFSFLILPVPNL